MDELSLYSMFLLGLAGTGHCIGMCGPLVFALAGRTGKIVPQIFYHLGRGLTYGIVGALAGGIGAGLAVAGLDDGASFLPSVAHVQVLFSLVAAGFLAWFGIARLGLVREPDWMSAANPEKIPGYNKTLHGAAISGNPFGMLLLGLMMGLLPCGLSYAAFARALAADGPLSGAALLLAFAAGTIPGLLLVGTGAAGLFRKYRRHSDIISGMIMIAMSLSLMADAFQSIFK